MAASSPPRRRLIGLSTKMYFSLVQSHNVIRSLLDILPRQIDPSALSRIDIFLMPDFVALGQMAEEIQSSGLGIWLGAQNCHWEDQGAYTGEVSPRVLRELGVRIVEVGHAERRRLFGENEGVVARKVAAVSRNGMVPLICVGERTRSDGDGDDDGTDDVGGGNVGAAVEECRSQVESALREVRSDAEVAIAYEPVWAIGAAHPASASHVVRVVEGIRQLECVREREGITRIVYGGSAGPGLWERLKGGVDGLFLGRFGHDPESFARTVREVAAA
ncbi:hypothetical protein E4U57_003775 [Claviceps arundinis]|uniref:Triosephosphate isomerase n=1 Tax=Claviceps arundinis TaxID=1623583 RepID=A0ABQ7P634_9HYPO|nr:hypothetical protein E4U57_003775 [Claviceps arundinis]